MRVNLPHRPPDHGDHDEDYLGDHDEDYRGDHDDDHQILLMPGFL